MYYISITSNSIQLFTRYEGNDLNSMTEIENSRCSDNWTIGLSNNQHMNWKSYGFNFKVHDFGSPLSHMTRLLVAQRSDLLPVNVFLAFLSGKVNVRKSTHSYRSHLIITFIIKTFDWRYIRSKIPLVRNPDRRWHRHSSIKFSWSKPMAP